MDDFPGTYFYGTLTNPVEMPRFASRVILNDFARKLRKIFRMTQ